MQDIDSHAFFESRIYTLSSEIACFHSIYTYIQFFALTLRGHYVIEFVEIQASSNRRYFFEHQGQRLVYLIIILHFPKCTLLKHLFLHILLRNQPTVVFVKVLEGGPDSLFSEKPLLIYSSSNKM